MERLAVGAAVLVALASVSAFAQCQAREQGNQCFLSTVGKPMPCGAVESPSLVEPQCTDADVEPVMAAPQVVVGAGAAVGGAYVLGEIGAAAAGTAHGVGAVGHIPVYGSTIAGLGVFGKAAASVTVPTTLGQMPILGSAVADIPVVGPVIAGPPHPVVVGAVAIDTFVLPKVAPCGYTQSSKFTMTDFNSPPRLRHYVNYLAPLPYTHPPIYGPADPNANVLPGEKVIEPETVETVSIDQ